jgi:hypothetical protein
LPAARRSAARRELERFFSAEGGAERNILEREYRFEALAALVSVALATGQRARAKEALAAARGDGERFRRGVPPRCRRGAAAELALDENRGADAQRLARESWRRWSALEMPYPSAPRARAPGSRAARRRGRGRARIELEGAARSLERLGAELDLRRVRARMDEFGAALRARRASWPAAWWWAPRRCARCSATPAGPI